MNNKPKFRAAGLCRRALLFPPFGPKVKAAKETKYHMEAEMPSFIYQLQTIKHFFYFGLSQEKETI